MQAYDSATSLALGAPSIQPLGAPPGFNDFTPTDANGDGSVIVGTSLIPGDNFSFSARGFRWTGAGFQDLGSLGGDSVRPMRTSGQGDVVVGMANLVPNSVEFRIFRWTAATGIQDLGATFAAAPVSISTDGTTMAASSFVWSGSLDGSTGLYTDLRSAVRQPVRHLRRRLGGRGQRPGSRLHGLSVDGHRRRGRAPGLGRLQQRPHRQLDLIERHVHGRLLELQEPAWSTWRLPSHGGPVERNDDPGAPLSSQRLSQRG